MTQTKQGAETNKQQEKIEKKHKNTYLTSDLIIKQLTNNLNHMLTSVNKLLLLHATIHAKLHMPLLTVRNFTQQIITNIKLCFEFLYTLGRSKTK